MEVFCFTFSPEDGTEQTFLLITVLKSFKKFKEFPFLDYNKLS